MRTSLRSVLFATLAACAVACHSDNAKNFDADAKSGPDGKRNGAKLIQPNQVDTDDVNFDQQDQTDWKQIELKGRPGVLGVELHWDNANSDLNVDVFNSFGEQIGASPGPTPGAQLKKVAVQIDNPGVYFIRVQAVKKGDASVYTVSAKWEGATDPDRDNDTVPDSIDRCPDQPGPTDNGGCPPAPRPEAAAPPTHHATHHEAECKASSDCPEGKSCEGGRCKAHKHASGEGVQGRIVSSYREAGALVLHIDKGSSAGVKEGSVGTVLDGPSGTNPLEGGQFTVTAVDETKCTAKTAALKSLGRNTRVAINVK